MPRSKAREPAPHPADVSKEDYLRTELLLLHESIARMSDSGSWQAVVAARRLAMKIRDEIDALREAADADFDPNDLDDVVATVLKMPDTVFRHPKLRARVKKCA